MIFLQSNYTYAGNAPQYGFFYFSYFLFISSISSKIFLENMHSKWLKRLYCGLEYSASFSRASSSAKSRKMYFFKHVTTGNSDVVPRIRPKNFKKKKEKHHSCSRRWWKTEEHGDTKLMAVAHIFWWCQRTDKPTGQERHSWANAAATWMSCFLSISLEGMLRGNLWRSDAWAQTNFCHVGAISQRCQPLTLPPSLSISS